MRDETIAIHGGFKSDPTTHAVAVPVYQTVAYQFDDAQHGADLFNLAVPGNIYTRIMNPTQAVLEERVAGLEGGVAALALSAGSAAVTYSILNLAAAGDNIVTVPQLYGGTYTLFAHTLPGMGIEVRFADGDSPEDLARLVDGRTKAIFCESIGNPAGNIVDLEAVSDLARAHGIATIVDNTVATPALLKPIEHGFDIVVHSLTKYMGGHGNSLGGAIVDSGRFAWAEHAARYPVFSTPEPSYHGVVYTEALGPAAYIGRARTVPLRNTGAAISPFNAFLILQGLETLNLRMERHCDNALAVARHLQSHPKVAWVNYAGLPGDRYHDLAVRYLDGRASGILTFGLAGGFDDGVRFYDALELFKRLVNIGDARSLACHPASTTHRQLNEEEQRSVGVRPEMIRLSVGIENIEDIIGDLDRALDAV
ncbi:MAG: O-acetylhomoserine aminocarboxypropyltransferase/cysteine synthase [Gemmatimonadetes bacterium]|nr:O-acetylhomoserine aminocarboxypropyltransferase/cysteine synthase [Gemmatimonadota bacterium]MXX73019.1 O-acetylhomoserine aminocarboxypropyltransferase/cysteine synthase [Gemmatimonadota bacterium]MYC92294.1 O-acetylhomoserine aminocarboxypropyltransferase/cysteine synthase [Gemmatimonadota bacterium]MYG34998.1 O-acetylhomoserine aminocarboxypropyltransferase/cysteine synthase [Gemmatimonadota bacterium]